MQAVPGKVSRNHQNSPEIDNLFILKFSRCMQRLINSPGNLSLPTRANASSCVLFLQKLFQNRFQFDEI